MINSYVKLLKSIAWVARGVAIKINRF